MHNIKVSFRNKVQQQKVKNLLLLRHFDNSLQIIYIFSFQTLVQKEQQCLEQLYNYTNGDEWYNKWDMTSQDYCNFYGITCSGLLNPDQDQYILEISLSSNNLTGYLPDCFSSDFTKLNKVYLGNNDLSQNQSDVSFLQTVNYVDASNSHIVGKTQNITLNASQTIKLINNDLSSVTANILDSYILDLTNTSLQGKIVFTAQSDFYRIFLADTQLNIDWQGTPQNILFLDAVNANVDIDIETLLEKLNGTNMKLLNLDNNKLTGMAPSANSIQQLKQQSSLEYISLAQNPFLCNTNGDNLFDCQILEPNQVQANGKQINVTAKLNSNFKYPSSFPKLQLFVKDEEKSNVVRTKIEEAQNCSQQINNYTVTMICYTKLQTTNASHVAIAVDNFSVSTGSILVNQMINQLLNRTEPDFSFKQHNDFKGIINNKNGGRISAQDSNVIQPVKSQPNVPPRILIQVTAYSQCPDFINIENYVFRPFSVKYPHLLSKINFTYVSMAQYNEQYKGFNATSLHGEYEAYKDLQYVCIQEIDKNYLLPIINCDVQGGFKCFENNIQDQDFKLEVRQCMQQKLGHNLLQRDQQTVKDLQSLGSPTVYADGNMICSWNYYDALGRPTKDDCAANYFGDADEFAEWLCNQEQMDNVAECYFIRNK